MITPRPDLRPEGAGRDPVRSTTAITRSKKLTKRIAINGVISYHQQCQRCGLKFDRIPRVNLNRSVKSLLTTMKN